MEKFFRLAEAKTTIGRELVGGTTTFLAMTYIFFVDPAILGDAGMDRAALVTATVVQPPLPGSAKRAANPGVSARWPGSSSP